MPSANGNVDVNEQHQILVDNLTSQALPAGTRSDPPAAAPDTAQHAEQAVQVKRKPGRPRKVPPKSTGGVGPLGTTSLPLSSPAAGTGITQAAYGPHLPYGLRLPDVHLALGPAASGSQSNAADVVPAGALMPQRRSSSVQIDMGKLLKSRSKAQLPGSKAMGSSTFPAHRIANGPIVSDGTSVMLTAGQPTYTAAQPAAAAAPAATTAAPAAVTNEAVPKPVSDGGMEAAAGASAVTTAAPAAVTNGAVLAPLSDGGMEAAAGAAVAAAAAGAPVTGGREAAEAGKPVMLADATGSPDKQTQMSAANRQPAGASAATLSAAVSPTPHEATSGKPSHTVYAYLQSHL